MMYPAESITWPPQYYTTFSPHPTERKNMASTAAPPRSLLAVPSGTSVSAASTPVASQNIKAGLAAVQFLERSALSSGSAAAGHALVSGQAISVAPLTPMGLDVTPFSHTAMMNRPSPAVSATAGNPPLKASTTATTASRRSPPPPRGPPPPVPGSVVGDAPVFSPSHPPPHYDPLGLVERANPGTIERAFVERTAMPAVHHGLTQLLEQLPTQPMQQFIETLRDSGERSGASNPAVRLPIPPRLGSGTDGALGLTREECLLVGEANNAAATTTTMTATPVTFAGRTPAINTAHGSSPRPVPYQFVKSGEYPVYACAVPTLPQLPALINRLVVDECISDLHIVVVGLSDLQCYINGKPYRGKPTPQSWWSCMLNPAECPSHSVGQPVSMQAAAEAEAALIKRLRAGLKVLAATAPVAGTASSQAEGSHASSELPKTAGQQSYPSISITLSPPAENDFTSSAQPPTPGGDDFLDYTHVHAGGGSIVSLAEAVQQTCAAAKGLDFTVHRLQCADDTLTPVGVYDDLLTICDVFCAPRIRSPPASAASTAEPVAPAGGGPAVPPPSSSAAAKSEAVVVPLASQLRPPSVIPDTAILVLSVDRWELVQHIQTVTSLYFVVLRDVECLKRNAQLAEAALTSGGNFAFAEEISGKVAERRRRRDEKRDLLIKQQLNHFAENRQDEPPDFLERRGAFRNARNQRRRREDEKRREVAFLQDSQAAMRIQSIIRTFVTRRRYRLAGGGPSSTGPVRREGGAAGTGGPPPTLGGTGAAAARGARSTTAAPNSSAVFYPRAKNSGAINAALDPGLLRQRYASGHFPLVDVVLSALRDTFTAEAINSKPLQRAATKAVLNWQVQFHRIQPCDEWDVSSEGEDWELKATDRVITDVSGAVNPLAYVVKALHSSKCTDVELMNDLHFNFRPYPALQKKAAMALQRLCMNIIYATFLSFHLKRKVLAAIEEPVSYVQRVLRLPPKAQGMLSFEQFCVTSAEQALLPVVHLTWLLPMFSRDLTYLPNTNRLPSSTPAGRPLLKFVGSTHILLGASGPTGAVIPDTVAEAAVQQLYRRVPIFLVPDMVTADQWNSVAESIIKRTACRRIMWLNMRPDAMVYCNGVPLILAARPPNVAHDGSLVDTKASFRGVNTRAAPPGSVTPNGLTSCSRASSNGALLSSAAAAGGGKSRIAHDLVVRSPTPDSTATGGNDSRSNSYQPSFASTDRVSAGGGGGGFVGRSSASDAHSSVVRQAANMGVHEFVGLAWEKIEADLVSELTALLEECETPPSAAVAATQAEGLTSIANSGGNDAASGNKPTKSSAPAGLPAPGTPAHAVVPAPGKLVVYYQEGTGRAAWDGIPTTAATGIPAVALNAQASYAASPPPVTLSARSSLNASVEDPHHHPTAASDTITPSQSLAQIPAVLSTLSQIPAVLSTLSHIHGVPSTLAQIPTVPTSCAPVVSSWLPGRNVADVDLELFDRPPCVNLTPTRFFPTNPIMRSQMDLVAQPTVQGAGMRDRAEFVSSQPSLRLCRNALQVVRPNPRPRAGGAGGFGGGATSGAEDGLTPSQHGLPTALVDLEPRGLPFGVNDKSFAAVAAGPGRRGARAIAKDRQTGMGHRSSGAGRLTSSVATEPLSDEEASLPVRVADVFRSPVQVGHEIRGKLRRSTSLDAPLLFVRLPLPNGLTQAWLKAVDVLYLLSREVFADPHIVLTLGVAGPDTVFIGAMCAVVYAVEIDKTGTLGVAATEGDRNGGGLHDSADAADVLLGGGIPGASSQHGHGRQHHHGGGVGRGKADHGGGGGGAGHHAMHSSPMDDPWSDVYRGSSSHGQGNAAPVSPFAAVCRLVRLHPRLELHQSVTFIDRLLDQIGCASALHGSIQRHMTQAETFAKNQQVNAASWHALQATQRLERYIVLILFHNFVKFVQEKRQVMSMMSVDFSFREHLMSLPIVMRILATLDPWEGQRGGPVPVIDRRAHQGEGGSDPLLRFGSSFRGMTPMVDGAPVAKPSTVDPTQPSHRTINDWLSSGGGTLSSTGSTTGLLDGGGANASEPPAAATIVHVAPTATSPFSAMGHSMWRWRRQAFVESIA